MKRFLKFDFDARVSGEILYPAGSVQSLEDGPSCQRWIQRGAVEISEKEFKEIKNPPKASTPMPRAPEKKSPEKKDEAKVADKKEEETDGL